MIFLMNASGCGAVHPAVGAAEALADAPVTEADCSQGGPRPGQRSAEAPGDGGVGIPRLPQWLE